MHLTHTEVGLGILIIGSGLAFGARSLEARAFRDPRRPRPWFVLRDHGFAVPAWRPWSSLLILLSLDGAVAVVASRDMHSRIPLITLAAIGTLLIARAGLVAYPMTLRREGIVLRRFVGHRLISWSEARHTHLLVRVLQDPPDPVAWAARARRGTAQPAPRLGWSISAIGRQPLAAVIRRYAGDAAARAAIGTGVEYDRLDQFRRRSPAPPPRTATPGATGIVAAPASTAAAPASAAAPVVTTAPTATIAAPAGAGSPDPGDTPVTVASSADS